MTDEVIAAIEEEFATQFLLIGWNGRGATQPHKEAWYFQTRDCVRGVAKVVEKFRPDYKLDRFYTNCGYLPPWPVGV